MAISRFHLKNLLSVKITPLKISVSFKNTKTARKKLPHEAQTTLKWMPKKKAYSIIFHLMSYKILMLTVEKFTDKRWQRNLIVNCSNNGKLSILFG